MFQATLFALLVLAAPARRVEVAGERITLGALVPSMPEPWASVDVGPAPLPTQARWVSAQTMENRVLAARLAPAPVGLPRRVRVSRPGQVVAEPRLRQWIRQALVEQLPVGVELRELTLTGGVVLPRGGVSVEVDMPSQLRDGRQTLNVGVLSDTANGARRTLVPVLADLRVPKVDTKPIIERGQDIIVVVTTPYVRVQSNGVAQQAGRLGEMIAVLPTQGARVLRGRVVDARMVEVLQ